MPYKDPIKAREAARIRMIRWRERHPALARARAREAMRHRRAANPEAVRAYNRAEYARNREKRIATVKRYVEANKARVYAWRRWYALSGDGGKHRNRARARYALLKGAKGSTTPEQVLARVAYFGARCYLCAAPYEQIDHVIPITRGGTNWPANLRPICRHCNIWKSNRLLSELPRRIAA